MAVHYICDMCKNIVESEQHITEVLIPVSATTMFGEVRYWRYPYNICVDCGAELNAYIRNAYPDGKSDRAKAIQKALNYKEEQDETESEIDI